MKKLIAIFTVVLFTAPAFAADWSFYGSQRIATWYADRDYGDGVVNGQNDDQATQWYFQGNSRLGAKVKADKVSGQIEFGLGTGGDGGDTNVVTRRAYGVWRFSDNAWLKVGKDNATVTDVISNQMYDADGNLYGEGNFYGRRPAGLTLGIGEFELAFLTPLRLRASALDDRYHRNGGQRYHRRRPGLLHSKTRGGLHAEARHGLHQTLRRLPVLQG